MFLYKNLHWATHLNSFHHVSSVCTTGNITLWWIPWCFDTVLVEYRTFLLKTLAEVQGGQTNGGGSAGFHIAFKYYCLISLCQVLETKQQKSKDTTLLHNNMLLNAESFSCICQSFEIFVSQISATVPVVLPAACHTLSLPAFRSVISCPIQSNKGKKCPIITIIKISVVSVAGTLNNP